jgi:hypothetical protein
LGDNKGRLTLGDRFANKTVLVTPISETEVKVSLARVIPEDEAWLYENPAALELVRGGLRQAKARKFSKRPPNLNAAARDAD